jgi:hypothetical protein
MFIEKFSGIMRQFSIVENRAFHSEPLFPGILSVPGIYRQFDYLPKTQLGAFQCGFDNNNSHISIRQPLLRPMARLTGLVWRANLSPRPEHMSPPAQKRRLIKPSIPGDRLIANAFAAALWSSRSMRTSTANHIGVLSVISVSPIPIWKRSSGAVRLSARYLRHALKRSQRGTPNKKMTKVSSPKLTGTHHPREVPSGFPREAESTYLS